jgi:hypothetical protein
MSLFSKIQRKENETWRAYKSSFLYNLEFINHYFIHILAIPLVLKWVDFHFVPS